MIRTDSKKSGKDFSLLTERPPSPQNRKPNMKNSKIESPELSHLIMYRMGQLGTATRLAELAGISRGHMSNIRKGKRNVSGEVLRKLGIRMVQPPVYFELMEPGELDFPLELLHELNKDSMEAKPGNPVGEDDLFERINNEGN